MKNAGSPRKWTYLEAQLIGGLIFVGLALSGMSTLYVLERSTNQTAQTELAAVKKQSRERQEEIWKHEPKNRALREQVRSLTPPTQIEVVRLWRIARAVCNQVDRSKLIGPWHTSYCYETLSVEEVVTNHPLYQNSLGLLYEQVLGDVQALCGANEAMGRGRPAECDAMLGS